MIENPLFLTVALGVLALLQVLVLLVLLRLSGKVSRLSRRISSPMPEVTPELADRKEGNAEQKKQFADFLEEDPARRELPKKEQFAAFRRWREDKGLNWTGKP